MTGAAAGGIPAAARAQPRAHRQPSAAGSIRHPLARALLVLTFSTGLVDAVSYLGLGRVFTANMTGNIVLLGFGIAGSGGLPVVAPLVSLGAFLVGSAVGGVLAVEDRRASRPARRPRARDRDRADPGRRDRRRGSRCATEHLRR